MSEKVMFFAVAVFAICFAVCYNILHDYNMKKLKEEQKKEMEERK